METPLGKFDAPSSEEFSAKLGQVVWLLGMSKEHSIRPISSIESSFTAPLLLKQLQIVSEGKNPIAVLTWAYASPLIRKRVDAGEPLELKDWRSGTELVIVDCVSPFVKEETVRERFLAEIEKLQFVHQNKMGG